jgi:hypothetical protein
MKNYFEVHAIIGFDRRAFREFSDHNRVLLKGI